MSHLAQVIQSVDMITSEEASKYKQLMDVEEFSQFTEKLLQLVQEMISSGILKHSLQVCKQKSFENVYIHVYTRNWRSQYKSSP